jgi:CheY-like chemotaxis protein
VVDTGIGISQEDLERIFEPFYTKKSMGRSGTGLGMAVVWGTVKDHRGYIDIHSKEGKGTSIVLYFPVTRKEFKKEVNLVSLESLKGHGESILVVDDVQEQREIASEILEKLGYTVMTVPSGEDAVYYLQNRPADLMVLDMIMDPGIDGLETYQRILKINPNQKAVIASGYSESTRVREAQRLGVGAYVKKPYLMEKIGRAVRAELDK